VPLRWSGVGRGVPGGAVPGEDTERGQARADYRIGDDPGNGASQQEWDGGTGDNSDQRDRDADGQRHAAPQQCGPLGGAPARDLLPVGDH
jgi:hypothetical protein